MKKDYKIWIPIKSEINNNEKYPEGYKEREIWICSIGENIGFEEDGKNESFSRPVLILRVFNKNFCHIVPLSKTNKRGKFYYPFDGKTGRISVALLSQSKAIDSSRLLRKLGVVNKNDFKIIQEKIKQILKL
jgi:mRNA interferase MazF